MIATKESKATAPNGTNHTTENDVSEKKEEKAEEQPIDSASEPQQPWPIAEVC